MEDQKESNRAYVYRVTNYWDNVLYIGSTEDLKARLYQHRKRLIPGFTQKYNTYKPCPERNEGSSEEHQNIEIAQTREKQLKGKTRAKKNAIVASHNPQWKDLSSIFS